MKFQSFVLSDIKDWAYAGCKDKQTVWRPVKVHAHNSIINLFKYLLKVYEQKRSLFNFPPVIYVKVEIDREGKSLRIRHSFWHSIGQFIFSLCSSLIGYFRSMQISHLASDNWQVVWFCTSYFNLFMLDNISFTRGVTKEKQTFKIKK